MEVAARGITAGHPAKFDWSLAQEPPHRFFVGLHLASVLPQQITEHPRHAHVVLSRVYTRPSRGLFVEGDGDILHVGIAVDFYSITGIQCNTNSV
jgi:hypothetical protein